MTQEYEYTLLPAKKGLFSSLSVPNFRLYITGHFISMIGVWMQAVALSWLVWRLTGSANWLGAVSFSNHALTFILGLIGGAVADRIYRRNLVLITQSLLMLQATALAVLTILHVITPWLIIGLVLFMGAVYAFNFPAQQSFITDIVGKGHVDNAVALSSSMIHAGRVVGPALAGIIIAYYGEGTCFFINAASFIALIAAILLMDKSSLNFQPKNDLPMYKAIKEGLKTAKQNQNLKRPLIIVAMISFFGMPYAILIPIFVDTVYGGGPELYGFLMASSAVGALLGALVMARSSGSNTLERNIGLASLGFAISLVAFAWVGKFWMGLVVMTFTGLFALIALASINARLQTEAPDHIRGRIMSLYTMMFLGVTPFGCLIAGLSAQKIGAPITLTIGGAVCIASGIWFLTSRKKRFRGHLSQAI